MVITEQIEKILKETLDSFSDYLYSPISYQLFRQPTYYLVHNIRQCFDAKEIQQWQLDHDFCPNTRVAFANLENFQLIEDELLQFYIERMKNEDFFNAEEELVSYENLDSEKVLIFFTDLFFSIIMYDRFDLFPIFEYNIDFYITLNQYQQGPFTIAQNYQSEHIIKILLKHNILTQEEINHLLKQEIQNNCSNKVKYLLDNHRVNINEYLQQCAALHAPDNLADGEDQRWHANHLAIFELLIQANFNLNLQNNDLDLLTIALKSHSMNIVDFLLLNGIGLRFALHTAISNEHNIILIKKLIDHSAEVNEQNNVGETPLHVALKYFTKHPKLFLKIIQLLLIAGSDLFLKDNRGFSARDFVMKYADYNLKNISLLLSLMGALQDKPFYILSGTLEKIACPLLKRKVEQENAIGLIINRNRIVAIEFMLMDILHVKIPIKLQFFAQRSRKASNVTHREDSYVKSMNTTLNEFIQKFCREFLPTKVNKEKIVAAYLDFFKESNNFDMVLTKLNELRMNEKHFLKYERFGLQSYGLTRSYMQVMQLGRLRLINLSKTRDFNFQVHDVKTIQKVFQANIYRNSFIRFFNRNTEQEQQFQYFINKFKHLKLPLAHI